MTTMTNPLPNVPSPAGVRMVADWEDVSTEDPYRYFEAPRTIVACKRDDVAVWAGGLQHADGRLEPEVCVNQLHGDRPITAARARQIARALINAADAIEGWSESE